MDAATQGLINHLNAIIATETNKAYDDCRRYQDEAYQRGHDRMRRLHAETAAARAQLDQIYSLFAKAEMMKTTILPVPADV